MTRFFLVECKSPAGPLKCIVESIEVLIDMGRNYDFKVLAEINEAYAKHLRNEWEKRDAQ